MTQVVDNMLAARRSHYDQVDWSIVEPYQLEVQRDLAALLPSDVSSILDIGCGNGFLTNSLSPRCTVVGVDISVVALRKLSVPGCLASAAQLPFADGAFDLVMANDVLEHLREDELAATLAEIERVAKHYIVTTVPFAEDLTASQRYSAEDSALHHMNEHQRSFDVPRLKALYRDFDLDSVVFSGVEWQRESRPVEAFNTLMVELGATPLADRPEETVLSSKDRAQILELLRADQAQALGRSPAMVDLCRLRTEAMGLYQRRSVRPDTRRLDHSIRATAKRVTSTAHTAVDLHVIDFRHFDRHQHGWLPTMARFPYVVTAARATAVSAGMRFIPPNGAASWDLKIGFYCNFEGKSALEISGTAARKTRLSVAHYGGDHCYRHLAMKAVAGPFRFDLEDIDISHSQYGALFSISIEGGEVTFETIRIAVPEPAYRMIYAEPIDYLRAPDDDIECFLSCRHYGAAVPVLEWFGDPQRVRSPPHPDILSPFNRAAEIATVANVALKYWTRHDETSPLRREVDEITLRFVDHRGQLHDLGARIDAMAERLAESAATHLQSIEALTSRLQNIETLATRVHDIEAVAEKLVGSAASHQQSIEALTSRLQNVETLATRVRDLDALALRLRNAEATAARGAERIVMLAGELQTIRHEQRLRRGVLGAVRELCDINSYIALDGGPKPGVALPATARAYFGLRRTALGKLLRRARPPVAANQTIAPITAPVASSKDGVDRTVTMLVPDDRIDRRVLLSGRSLSRAGWRVTVIAAPYPEPFDQDQLDFPELQIARVDTSRAVVMPPDALPGNRRHSLRWREIYFYHFNFLDLALKHPAHVYVANDLPVLPAAAVATVQARGALVYDAHELFPEIGYYSAEQRDLYSKAEADLIQDAALVTTINRSIAEEMAARYGIPVPAVILNAPATPAQDAPTRATLRAELQIPVDKRILLYQGALSLYRNLEDLIAAMAVVETDDVVLVLMGPGAERRAVLEGIARDNGTLGLRVLFRDPVPQDVLLSYTAGADVGIVPYPPVDLNSRYCTPNKLFEFIVAGIPILANDLPELRKFVHDTGFGQVHPLDGPSAIAAAIDAMFRSDLRDYRTQLAVHRHEYTWDAQGRKLVDLYQPLAPTGASVNRQGEARADAMNCAASATPWPR